MSLRTKLLLPLVVVMATLSWSQSAAPAPIDAKRGSVATGSIQSERNGELYLNTSPCSVARVVIFRAPYKKTASGQINCYPSRYDGFTVEQQ
jgi:hypothetical protein